MTNFERFVAFAVTILYPCAVIGIAGFAISKHYWWLIALTAFLAWLGFAKWREYARKIIG